MGHSDCVERYKLDELRSQLDRVQSDLKRESAEHKHRLDHLLDEVQTLVIKVRQQGDEIENLTTHLSTLEEAIALNHVKGPDGVCVEDCWSCKIKDTIKGTQVAEKLMGRG